jgi:hypothetical protein
MGSLLFKYLSLRRGTRAKPAFVHMLPSGATQAHDADLLVMNGFLKRKAGDYSAARKHREEAVTLNTD